MSTPYDRGKCASCGIELASDNRQAVCAPCSHSGEESRRARPDADFWKSAEVAEAVCERDFGKLLRAYRNAFAPVLTQGELALLLGIGQAQVSRIESGRTPANNLEKLLRWALAIEVPSGVLWFDVPTVLPRSDDVAPALPTGFPGQVGAVRATAAQVGPAARRPESPTSVEQVAAIRRTTGQFRVLDNQFGGVHARAAVDAFIRADVEVALANGRFARGARPMYERAAAELYQLSGWMAYDMDDERDGRRKFRVALDLSVTARDDSLAAEMLSAMSHHAAFSRRAEEAIGLAIAARRAAHRSGIPALQAESAVLEAQGLALQMDTRECIAALRRAESVFASATPTNTPDWLRYFDKAYLSAKFAHALRDIGLLADAERFARESLQMSDGYDRGRLFNTALLASVLADSGAVEESTALAREAVGMTGRVRSSRAHWYLHDAGKRLLRYSSAQGVKDLHRDMLAMNHGSRFCSPTD